MRVVTENTVDCDNCGEVLEYNKEDIHIGAYGAAFVTCPTCNNKVYVDDGIDLTPDNLRFPLHYEGSRVNADVDTEMIDSLVRRMINSVTEYDPIAYVVGSGFFIMVHFQDDEGAYQIIVCTDAVYDTWVPFEES